MPDIQEIRRFGEHGNAFGFLRLLFASLVIVAHTPELADGNARREIMTRLFGTITFGGIAVDGFFLISGYLIVGSFIKQPQIRAYLAKRVARIYPGFIVASLASLAIFAPLGGSPPAALVADGVGALRRILTLDVPYAPGVFPGAAISQINGSLWTIAYEFRCYLLVLLLGVCGAFARPRLIAALTAGMLIAFEALPLTITQRVDQALPYSHVWMGDIASSLRLTGIFLAGSLFLLWRDRIRFTRANMAAAGIGLIACLFVPWLAEPAIAICGGWLLFGFAHSDRTRWLKRINNRNDISYGVYLYAWPIGQLLIWYCPALDLAVIALLTLMLSCACGWLSWHAVEKPVMEQLRRRLTRSSADRVVRKASPAG